MIADDFFMNRCLELANLGAGRVAPNPMVGCVLVFDGKIAGEGWHQEYGGSHAEVNAINSVHNKELLSNSTLYVNLEPCSHFGKTPPCANFILENKIKKVVVAMLDPNPLVAGSGIKLLKDNGVEVVQGICEKEAKWLNRRFIKFHLKKKPYIILKWAQSANNFIAPDYNKMTTEEFEKQRHITGRIVQKLVHKWRTQEDAIMVGTNTAFSDNPALDAREWAGRNPLRVTLDKNLRLPPTLKIFDQKTKTIVFTEKVKDSSDNLEFIRFNFDTNLMENVFSELYSRNIQSLIIEGGTVLLNHIISKNIWDEAIVFTSPKQISNGIIAPVISGSIINQSIIDTVLMTHYIKA